MPRTFITTFMFCLFLQGIALAQSSPAITPQYPSVIQKISRFFEDMYNDIFHAEKDPDLSGTLIAPFADKARLESLPEQQKKTGVLSINQSPLDQAHLSAHDLSGWLLSAIPQCLSFTADSYPEHIKTLSTGFSDNGLAQLNAWVTTTGILSSLQNNGLQLNGFVSETPFLLNEWVVNGRYRWLFEIPVMVSFVPQGAVSYSQANNIKTQHLILTLQLGRVGDSVLEHGIKIESWSVRDNNRKN